MRPPLALGLIAAMTAHAAASADDKRPMTVDDLLAVKSVSDPQVSPDGKLVAYVVSEVDRDANKSNSSLWLVPVEGGEPRRLTTAPGANNHPRWSPDGKTIAFVSSRSGSPQVWLLPLDGGEPRQLTKLPVGVSGPIWSPKGDRIAFAAEVVPGQTPEQTAESDKKKEGEKANVRAFDDLMIRHWSSWDEGKRNHLFVADAATGEAKDLIPGWKANVPPGPFGGSEEYAWSPDGESLAFTSEPLKDHPWSTNTDIWLIPASGGEPKNLTEANKGADSQPAFSPAGDVLAYLSQARAGFEADQWVLTALPLKNSKSGVPLSKGLDRPIQSFTWRPKLGGFAVLDDGGTEPIAKINISYVVDGVVYSFPLINTAPRLVTGGVNTSVQVADGPERLVFLRGDTAHPAEVYSAKLDGSDLKKLTDHNGPLLASLDLPEAESFTFSGADGDPVQGWLIRPPGFDESKKYPVLFLIHGGPQGAWHDEWHARWNYPLFAAPGYAVVAVNPRGSTGFGQKFTDQISGDWAGKVYDDLMKGLDHAIQTYPFLDRDRVAAAGGSYGGYMVNWIAGHTDRFKALISHAGVFDLHSKYFTTEELWFPEWEFKGTPWENPEQYRKLSPSHYVENFKTPTLVIHGSLDFRVNEAQGLGMFTALRRRGVPARFVLFPDEGHWILKPANRVAWWAEVHAWLKAHLDPKPAG